MNYTEIKLHINIDEINNRLKQYLYELISINKNITIKRGWEEGLHLKIIGFINRQEKQQIIDELLSLLKDYPTKEYDIELFRSEYKKVQQILLRNTGNELKTIRQNQVSIPEPLNLLKLNNEEQYELYLEIHHAIDLQYMNKYFVENNKILDITKDLMHFYSQLPQSSNEKIADELNGGYNSHLSHIVGFLYSLPNGAAKKIKKDFNKRYEDDKSQLEEPLLESNLTNWLLPIINSVEKMVANKKIDFFAPYKLEDLGDFENSNISENHKSVYRNQELLEFINKDPDFIANRWILNVLYEKLLVLNITPIEKYYMNYMICRLKFNSEELKVII